VRDKIEATGAGLLYLPPYSPDLNPIEKCWAKIKQVLRTLKARTADTLDPAISDAIAAITSQDASGWLHHCGYQHTKC
jgi:transposase